MFTILLTVTIGLIIAAMIFARYFFGGLPTLWMPDENVFIDPKVGKSNKFPNLSTDKSSVHLSVIVPAYNEEERLPIMLNETIDYLKQREKTDKTFTWEIIVVDDGSKDKTTKIALDYVKEETVDNMRVLTLKKNRGKGGAVKRGMMVARGQYLLMVDADGATKFADLDRVESRLKNVEKEGLGIGIGSRAHLQEEAEAKRNFFRNILMWGFHFLVTTVLSVSSIKDTQCGFKLFSRKSAQMLFPNMHVERWAFDVELIYCADRKKIPMVEVPVNWTEIPGSKLSPIAASIQMAKDLVRIRLAYVSGAWKMNN